MLKRKHVKLHKGRAGGDSDPFAQLPVEVLKSPACATLPHIAHRVLVALAAQFNGKRDNGTLSLTNKTAAEYGIFDPHARGDALRELEARGLIVRTRLGTRSPPRSALYALAWRNIDEPRPNDPYDEAKPSLLPPDGWRRWRTDKRLPHWTIERREDPRGPRFASVGPTTTPGGGHHQRTPDLMVAHHQRRPKV